MTGIRYDKTGHGINIASWKHESFIFVFSYSIKKTLNIYSIYQQIPIFKRKCWAIPHLSYTVDISLPTMTWCASD